eukprot:GHVT01005919.1.p2 GENE.GHVT01005919.1~~GHVT01005919.1.p2  ORF type:complete len:269 (-),score=32.08 GHVT01005919.1:460-1266(-)
MPGDSWDKECLNKYSKIEGFVKRFLMPTQDEELSEKLLGKTPQNDTKLVVYKQSNRALIKLNAKAGSKAMHIYIPLDQVQRYVDNEETPTKLVSELAKLDKIDLSTKKGIPFSAFLDLECKDGMINLVPIQQCSPAVASTLKDIGTLFDEEVKFPVLNGYMERVEKIKSENAESEYSTENNKQEWVQNLAEPTLPKQALELLKEAGFPVTVVKLGNGFYCELAGSRASLSYASVPGPKVIQILQQLVKNKDKYNNKNLVSLYNHFVSV